MINNEKILEQGINFAWIYENIKTIEELKALNQLWQDFMERMTEDITNEGRDAGFNIQMDELEVEE